MTKDSADEGYRTETHGNAVLETAGDVTPTVRSGVTERMSSDATESDSSGVACPTCNDTFGTEGGMKVHHARVHGESIAGVEVTCDWCGEQYRKKPSHAEKMEHHFCGRECFGKWEAENYNGEDNPCWRGGTSSATVECDHCGKEFQRAECHRRGEREFCGVDCMGTWRSEHIHGEDTYQWKGGPVDVECANCGTTIERTPAKVEGRERHYCGWDCMGEWRSENLRGEYSPAWKGGHGDYYGASWPESRIERLELDGYECVVCGVGQEEHIEMHGAELSVHHIVRKESFVREDGTLDEEQAHDMSNLVTLCRKHHKEWEGIPLRPEVDNGAP